MCSAPAVSVSSVRVSLTASTASDSGVNGLLVSSSDLNILVLFGRFALVRLDDLRLDARHCRRLAGRHHRLGGAAAGRSRMRQIFLVIAGAWIERHGAGRDALLRVQ